PRHAGVARHGRRACAVLGRLEPPAEGIRQAASDLTRKAAAHNKTNWRLAMKTHVVSKQEWEGARARMLVKEKAMTRHPAALVAERRRMPWMAVDKTYGFDGPAGKVSLLDLFDGRRQ